MKLISFLKDNRVRSGVLVDESVVDLNNSCYLMLIEKGEDEQFAERYCNSIFPYRYVRSYPSWKKIN